MAKDSLTKEKLIENIDNPLEFFKLLRSGKSEEYLPFIQNIKNVDYFDLAHKALEADMNAYSVGDSLSHIAGYSTLNHSNVLKLYKTLYDKENARSTHYRVSKVLATNNLQFSKKLLEEMLTIEEPFVIPCVAAILVMLHNKYGESQYETIINYLSDDANLIKLKIAISYIASFDFTKQQLKKILKLFKEKNELSNNEIDRELLYSSYDLIKKGYGSFSELLLLYANSSDLDIKYSLSQILMLGDNDYAGKDWFKKCFMSLCDTNIGDQAIIDNIDMVLCEYVKKDSYDFIKEFLYKWVESSNISTRFSSNTLSSFSSELSKAKLTNRFVTESLLFESGKIHSLLPSIANGNTVLDSNIISKLSEEEIIYICRKILGYFYEFNPMASLVFSILSAENISNNTKGIVIEVFVGHIGKNYTHDTLEFFGGLDDDNLNKNETEAKKIIIENIESDKEARSKLPNLKELKPPSQQNRVIARTESIAMKKAMEKAEEKSIFSLFSSGKTIIRHGRGWFRDIDGKLTDISHMSSMSHSVTMPSATRSHPVDFEYERWHFRLAKKEI